MNLGAGLPAPLVEPFRDRLVTDPGILFTRPAGAIYVQPITPQPVSATTIRDILAKRSGSAGKLHGLLPPAVLAYIDLHHLYGSGSDAT